MARPYQDSFENITSPLTPASAAPSTPISYQANVNRQKTKKWVEAKSVDYGGDDWGDEDDYYEPPPLPKPTGFRQPGQAAHSETNKKAYGGLPTLPAESQERSVTNPAAPLQRSNSFTKDDDRRTFSISHLDTQPTSPAVTSPTRPPALSVLTQRPSTGLRKAVPAPAPVEVPSPQIRGRDTNSLASQSATNTPVETISASSDYQQRRDFSPSAVPPPLHTRAISPRSRSNSPAVAYVPRKSSFGQSSAPDLSQVISATSPGVVSPKPWVAGRSSSPGAASRVSQEAAPSPRPWTAGRSDSPSTASRGSQELPAHRTLTPGRSDSPGAAAKAPAPAPTAKALPFIRPADIYRRLEEERQKERQSLESSRPSMDSVLGRGEEASSSAAPSVTVQPTIEQPAARARRGSFERDETPDSGRRLAPMLEPVMERKSEYGFEGLVAKSPETAAFLQQEAAKAEPSGPIEQTTLDISASQRFSTSPKLPDLHRMSGFSMDFFSQTKPDADISINTSVQEEKPALTQDGPSLRNQPSLGFTSMVHQAFDRDETSVPETPASLTASGVRRTDSESTGTASISPIMSRVSSSGTTDRYREFDSRDTSTPAIAEEQEPDSRRTSAKISQESLLRKPTPEQGVQTAVSQNPQQAIHLGHRRNLSKPSPDNSPARTPHLEISRQPSWEEARISEGLSPVSDLEPPKPIGNEESFRPDLPGGWVSYGTTASEIPGSDAGEKAQSEATGTGIPSIGGTYQNDENDESDGEELDLTTPKRLLPQSAVGAVVAKFERSSRSQTPVLPLSQGTVPSNSGIQTSDLSLAPSGNPYASSELDPRLTNIQKSVDKPAGPSDSADQLQPPTIDISASSSPSIGPTPPPKDTPVIGSSSMKDEDYFPHPAPLKPRNSGQISATAPIETDRPQILPTLSTSTSPLDDEADKLRKEIVKSLSPVSVNDNTPKALVSQLDWTDPTRIESPLASPNIRESTYLPSEYDNYWASTDETDVPVQSAEQFEPMSAVSEISGLSSDNGQGPISRDEELIPPIPPLSPQGRSMEQSSSMEHPTLERRFSWEMGPEQVNTPQETLSSQQAFKGEVTSASPFSTPTDPAAPLTIEPTTPQADQSTFVSATQADEVANNTPTGHLGPDPALVIGGVAATTMAAGATAMSGQAPPAGTSERRLSLADEKGLTNASAYSLSPTPPEDQHPSKSGQKIISMLDVGLDAPASVKPTEETQHQISPAPNSATQSPHNSIQSPQTFGPRPQHMSNTPRVRQFREIAALRTPAERIAAYKESQMQFATMDSGLSDWLHFASSPVDAQAPRTPSAQFDTEKLMSNLPNISGQPGSTAQQPQPYYQQYLNASTPTTPITPVVRGTATMPGSQGFGHSGGKITTHQVSAKSKELLHSAGIFGGKASKAGKGLLAKGKSRFMGSSGDKTLSTSQEATHNATPTKPAATRRSSWGFPLPHHHHSHSPSRAAAATDTSLGPASDTPTSSRGRTDEQPLPLPPGIREGGNDSPRSSISTAPPPVLELNLPSSSLRDDVYTSPNELDDDDEARDGLGKPAPIGKYQPSWDPFNATPIVEEEGFQLENSPPRGSKSEVVMEPTLVLRDETKFEDVKPDVTAIAEAETMAPTARLAPKLEDEQGITGAPMSAGQLKPLHLRGTSDVSAMSAESPVASQPAPQTQQPPAAALPRTVPPLTQPSAAPTESQRPATISSITPPTLPESQAVATKEEQQRPASESSSQDQSGGSGWLPPIRRSSTFGFGLMAKKAKTRFSIDDGDEDGEPRRDSSTLGQGEQQSSTVASGPSEASGAAVMAVPPAIVPGTGSDQVQGQVQGQPQSEVQAPTQAPAQIQVQAIAQTSVQPTSQARPQTPVVAQIPAQALIQASAQTSIVAPIPVQARAAVAPIIMPTSNVPSQDHASAVEAAFGPAASARMSGQIERVMNERYSFQDDSRMPAREVLSRPPGKKTDSSDYDSAIQTPNIPSSAGQYAPQNSYVDIQPGGQRPPVVVAQRPNEEWRPVQTPPEQKRSMPPSSHARHSSLEGQRNRSGSSSSQGPAVGFHMPTSNRPPSFEGQRSRPPSFEGQRRPPSFSSQPPKITPQYTERIPAYGRPASVPLRSLDQPPSSADKYPGLFQKEQFANETNVDDDLPQYHSPTVSKEDSFHPRQLPTEYQLPGVGPPQDDPRDNPSPRRNSGFFKEIGGKLTRATSRDKGHPDPDAGNSSPRRPIESRDSDSTFDSVEKDDEKKVKRRSGLLSVLSRSSTEQRPPQSRESMVTHRPPSRTDLLSQGMPSPSSPLVPQEKKKTFFSSGTAAPTKRLSRTNTAERLSVQEDKKDKPTKKRFSGITNIFHRSSGDHSRPGSRNDAAVTQDPRRSQQSMASLQRAPTDQEMKAPQPGPSGPGPQIPQGQDTRVFHQNSQGHRIPLGHGRPPTMSPEMEPEDQAFRSSQQFAQNWRFSGQQGPPVSQQPGMGGQDPRFSQQQSVDPRAMVPGPPQPQQGPQLGQRLPGPQDPRMFQQGQQDPRRGSQGQYYPQPQVQMGPQQAPNQQMYRQLHPSTEPQRQGSFQGGGPQGPGVVPQQQAGYALFPAAGVPAQRQSTPPKGGLLKKAPSPQNSTTKRPENKTRKSSSLFSGLLGKRSSGTLEKSNTPAGSPGFQQPQAQGPPPNVQYQQQRSIGFDPRTQEQDRGRQMPPQQRYESPPIPGAYSLVRGEGHLAPTGYDPRGLNQQYPPHQPYGYNQGYSSAYPNQQIYPASQFPQGQGPPQWQQPQGPQQQQGLHLNLARQNGHMRALSTEDLLARSPARAQFDQQAPYQLSLPAEDDGTLDEEEARILRDRSPSRRNDQLPALPAGQQPLAAPGQSISPPLSENAQAPLSPATTTSSIPPPPPPKFGSLDLESSIDRSNTRATAVSAVSQLSNGHGNGNGNGVAPGNGFRHDSGRSLSVPTPPQASHISPPSTPRGPRSVSPAEEDIYGVSPHLGPASDKTLSQPQSQELLSQNQNQNQEQKVLGRAASQEAKALMAKGQGSREGSRGGTPGMGTDKPLPRIRVPEAEEKIPMEGQEQEVQVQDEDEAPKMSATSFPGDEWRPYGYEEGWD